MTLCEHEKDRMECYACYEEAMSGVDDDDNSRDTVCSLPPTHTFRLQSGVGSKVAVPISALPYNQNPIENIVATILASGKLAERRPLSLFLIAPFATGKSTTLGRFKQTPQVLSVNELTRWALMDDIKTSMDKGYIPTHLIIDDWTVMTQQAKDVVSTLKGALSKLTEEGITRSKSKYYTLDANHYSEELRPWGSIKIGTILGMTKEAYRNGQVANGASGFTSRFVVASYQLNPIILAIIGKDVVENRPIPQISIPSFSFRTEVTCDTTKIAEKVAVLRNATNFRQLVNGTIFIKSIALKNGRTSVIDADIDEMNYLSKWMNTDCKETP